MSTDTLDAKRHAHDLIEQLEPAQVATAVRLLQAIAHEEAFSEEDRTAIAPSQEYFRNGGKGISFEQLVADCGFTMDDIRKP